jgi:Ca2+/H+ antiporter
MTARWTVLEVVAHRVGEPFGSLVLAVVPGRATLQRGGVHLVLFDAFLFLTVNP